MTESIIPFSHSLEKVSKVTNIFCIPQIDNISSTFLSFCSSSCFPWHSFSIISSPLPWFLVSSCLSFSSSTPYPSHLLSSPFPSSLIFSELFSSVTFLSSLSLSCRKSVMLKHHPATDLCKSNTPLVSEREKRTTLFPQSGRTAFSTIVPTEVNYGWPSILHTLKRTASTGHKTLSICWIHQSSL